MQGEAYAEPEPEAGSGALPEALEAGAPIEVHEPAPPTQEGKRNLKVRITEVRMEYPKADEQAYLLPGEPLAIRIAYEAVERVDDVVFGIAIHDVEGDLVFGSNTDFLDVALGALHGPGVVTFETDHVPLLDGTYFVTIGIHSHDEATVYDWREHRHKFEVMNPSRTSGRVHMGIRVSIDKDQGQGAA
jgi:lipopolysaccharide transport system ATP-binding protein